MFQGPTNANALEMEMQSASSKFDMVFCCNINTLCVSKVFSVSSFRSLIHMAGKADPFDPLASGQTLAPAQAPRRSPARGERERRSPENMKVKKSRQKSTDSEVNSRAKSQQHLQLFYTFSILFL